MKPAIIVTLHDSPMDGIKSIVSYPEGQPEKATELHDDWFPENVAKQVAESIASEMQQENPDQQIKLKL